MGGAARAQAAKSGAQEAPGTLTLRVNSRVVLTDVTVTDREGNPVRGLKASDFRIFDDGHPEKLTSFKPHAEKARGAWAASARETAGVSSNAAMLHAPPVVNAILIDTTTIRLIDQMYLYEQLRRFVRTLPAGEPVAIFVRAGEMTLMVQGFTSNHALLDKGIREAIPHFQQEDAEYATGFDTLRQMAYYLSQVPGRKNILWFSGGSNLFLEADPTDPLPVADNGLRRIVYDQLEKERIAIYPIDARGLEGDSLAMAGQHLLMTQDAESTGGEAWFNTNGLAEAARHIVATDGDYYTLTYSPAGLTDSGKWHRVIVKLVRGDYRLSYRRGYYDDGRSGTGPTRKTRRMLRAGGGTTEIPNDRSVPIPFMVRVAAVSRKRAAAAIAAGELAKPKRGQVSYAIGFAIPAAELSPRSVKDHEAKYELGCAVLALDHYGTPEAHKMRKLIVTADERQIHAAPKGKIAFAEGVNLTKGETYLDLAVWDMTTERLGTLDMRVNVTKRGKATQEGAGN